MDKFFDYLRKRYFVDYENKEITDIRQAVYDFLDKLLETFNRMNEVLKIEYLVPCGSMEEKTTVWGEENTTIEYDPSFAINTIEFDCLAVLQPIVPDMETEPACPGYKKLTSKTLTTLAEEKSKMENSKSYKTAESAYIKDAMDTLASLLLWRTDDISSAASASDNEDTSFLTFVEQEIEKRIRSGESVSLYQSLLRLYKFVNGSSKSFSTEFTVCVDSAVEAMCLASVTKISSVDEDITTYEVDMPTDTLQYRRCLPGCQLALGWKSKANPKTEKTIYIDFVPAFQIPESSTEFEDDAHPSFLVAKGCRNPYCEAGCWRLSHCRAECEALKMTSQCHRDVYKFLKIFNHSKLSRRLDNALKSYHIKTAVLTHMKTCAKTTENITGCLCRVLDILISYIDKGEVPHWKDPNYSLKLKLDTCHSFVPILLQFIFDQAVNQSPRLLSLNICCEICSGKEKYLHEAGSRLSEIVCQIIAGKECYSDFEKEIEETLFKAADLPPLYYQENLKYSVVVDFMENPPETTTIYQRSDNL